MCTVVLVVIIWFLFVVHSGWFYFCFANPFRVHLSFYLFPPPFDVVLETHAYSSFNVKKAAIPREWPLAVGIPLKVSLYGFFFFFFF